MSEQIKEMFADISDKYDNMNNILSLGMHHKWRRELVSLSDVEKGDRVLDCASGTGDLAIEFKRAVGSEGNVLATDFCMDMLEHLPHKASKNGLNIDIELADIMDLKYDDNEFDICSISYGIRNVDDPKKGLEEMARVIKPGGRLMILETGKPKGVMKPLFNLYSHKLFPVLGGMIAGKKAAYTYLPHSIEKFPYGNEFVQLLESTNKFEEIKVYPQLFGVSYIYKAIVA